MPQEIVSQFDRKYALPIETYRQTQTVAQRNLIPSEIRWEGMLVYVVTDQLTYALSGGITNADWVPAGDILNVTVENVLTSNSTVNALSANMGRVLNESKLDSVVAGANISIDNTDPLNPIISSSGGGAVDWGDIGGTLSNQSDLNSALNDRVLKAGDTMSGNLRQESGIVWDVSNADKAFQAADARDEGDEARLHWYGEDTLGASQPFQHAWFDGSAYMNITGGTNFFQFERVGGLTWIISSGTSGDAVLRIQADTDNNNEDDNPRIEMFQDGGITQTAIRLIGDPDTVFTGSTANSTAFVNAAANDFHWAANGIKRMTLQGGGSLSVLGNVTAENGGLILGVNTSNGSVDFNKSDTGGRLIQWEINYFR